MNVLLKVVSASILFAASANAQPVNGDDAQKVLDNYDFLISLYRDCSEGIAGAGFNALKTAYASCFPVQKLR